MFFKRKPKINDKTIKELIWKLETMYTDKEMEQLSKMFHPDQRDISFLNHFSLMMNFQIYNITSEILKLELLDMNEEEASFTYTRKHMYTCINEEDEKGTNPNNISSYYVQLKVEDKKIWIRKYARYSELFLDLQGKILSGENAVVPPGAVYFDNMKRFIDIIQLQHFKPATYLTYTDSEFIGYYPEEERYTYRTSEKLTFDYFQKLEADSIEEHTNAYMEGNNLEYSDILLQGENYSIIESKFKGSSGVQHELILSMLAPDGFFMVRFLKSRNAPIEEVLRQCLIEQMKKATTNLDVSI
ncbi:hypothetical protein [Psychrobacillus lasiicapitis]|uniref:Uncharacterized protein n=1 Tax=Psychrobacillus lasiicapitis TaxID=1636719 RepID=A0A544T4N5_9BACI|nr:hypothetical protein [Psychrobacillus lasiicapitis]TQR12407.1 hypothetical protein FG382_12300 [Psychrobacillus lasiicapitis]GGA37845.1 hypothetical protein GCM10011384_29230 [Psychrobacillus lasiicapitis]